jgi:hypothetical protein
MFFRNQQTQLGALFLDVLVSEQLSLPSKVTQYPIETGDGDISDHITANRAELTIVGAVSASESFAITFGPLCYSKLIDTIDTLSQMHRDRQPFTVVTGLGQYDEMALTSLTIDRTNSAQTGGQWLQINAQMRHIKKVDLKKADVSAADKTSQTASTDSSGTANGKTGKTEKPAGSSGNASTSQPGDTMGFSLGNRTGTLGPRSGVTP